MGGYRSAELGGVRIAWIEEGEGDAVLLVHGFGSTAAVNWEATGWLSLLAGSGFRAIALDNRGHGRSTRFYDPADYGADRMAEDALRLLDHLGIARARAVGYSMGARIAASLAAAYPDRVASLVLGGIGDVLVHGNPAAEAIAEALEAASLAEIRGRLPRMFRRFAEFTGSDLRALAACMRGQASGLPPDVLGAIRVPTLVAVGAADELAGSAADLAERIAGAEVLIVNGVDHMFAPGSPAFKAGVLDFLRRPS